MNSKVKEYVELRKERLKEEVEGKAIKLVVIQVGDNPASNSYIKGKIKDCAEVGIISEHKKLEADKTTKDLVGLIYELNYDTACHGIIVQLPLPPHIDVKKVQLAIDPRKDVDGFHPMSLFNPCTPMGVINFLKYVNYDFEGKNALVIGRSDIVGKPLARMLTDLNCTVTLAHSKSNNIGNLMESSDIIFTAINSIEYYNEFFRYNLRFANPIIDIGLGVSKRDNKLHGNLSEKLVTILRREFKFKDVLSGTGGVGLLTRLQLLDNVVQAFNILEFKKQRGK